MKYTKNAVYAMVIVLLLSLGSCDKKKLSIQQDYPFEVTVLPVPSGIARGQRVEMRFTIKAKGDFDGAQYSIRYFQFEGSGALQLYNEAPFRPNDIYPLPGREFRLYYTSRSDAAQKFELWIGDQFDNEQHFSFQFDPIQGPGGVTGVSGFTGTKGFAPQVD